MHSQLLKSIFIMLSLPRYLITEKISEIVSADHDTFVSNRCGCFFISNYSYDQDHIGILFGRVKK